MVPNRSKIKAFMTFGHFLNISNSQKLEMNRFSSITNSWRLLGKYVFDAIGGLIVRMGSENTPK